MDINISRFGLAAGRRFMQLFFERKRSTVAEDPFQILIKSGPVGGPWWSIGFSVIIIKGNSLPKPCFFEVFRPQPHHSVSTLLQVFAAGGYIQYRKSCCLVSFQGTIIEEYSPGTF